jgi:thymidylate kinase
VLTARDRCRASRRARAFADHGGIVICDRYPLAQIVSMDGPRERELRPDLPLSVVVNRLAELERRYYRRIPSPDVVIVLKVTPETAVARRAGEDAEVVRARSEEIMRTSWDSIGAEIVDADRSPAEVLSQIKAHIWAVV